MTTTATRSTAFLSIKQWGIPLTLALVAILVAASGQDATLALRYQRPSIIDGQLWRIVTGNLVHLGWQHLVMNVIGLMLIWALLKDVYSQLPWIAIISISGLGVSLGLLTLTPEIHWYVGLSGLLHGMFLAGVIGNLRRREWRDALLLAAVVAKLAYEQIAGAVPGSAEFANGPVVVDAHLYGAIAGALCAAVFRPRAPSHHIHSG